MKKVFRISNHRMADFPKLQAALAESFGIHVSTSPYVDQPLGKSTNEWHEVLTSADLTDNATLRVTAFCGGFLQGMDAQASPRGE